MQRRLLVFLGLPLVAALAACGPSDAPIPEMPTFAAHVAPIFTTRCVRCHGANGMLNDGLNADGTPSQVGPPSICYLSMYNDEGDCSAAGELAGNCKRGAHYCAMPMGDPPVSYIEAYLLVLTQEAGGMPPLPLPAVSDHDKEVVRRWLKNPVP